MGNPILVVDDDEDNCILMQKMIEHFGKSADVAGDADSCMNYLKENTPSLIFLDISLPGKDGFAVLQDIKALDKGINVVMFSAHDKAKEATDAGAAEFLSKPFNPEDLEKIISKFVK
ncbi:MAG: response regulator [Simkaniaceae bacterium]|nr:response regulator [Simkaniaceae bacterium]